MKAKDLKTGVLYWIAGQGPMRIEVLPNPPTKTTITLKTPDGVHYYADESQIVKPMTAELMDIHVGEMRSHLTVSDTLLEWQKELSAR